MKFSNFNDCNDFMKNCGFDLRNIADFSNRCHDESTTGTTGNSNNGSGNNNNTNSAEGCDDIPLGFQDLNPQLFIIVGEMIGDVMAGNLPFNMQNAIGNWFMLIGQAIVTYNSQQQYLEGGPGRRYNIKNKNAFNPNCKSGSQSSNNSDSSNNGTSNNSGDNSNNSENTNYKSEINQLTQCMNTLICQVESLQDEIKYIKMKI